MTRIRALSSDRALNAQTTSFSIPGTCVGILNESTIIYDGHVVERPLLRDSYCRLTGCQSRTSILLFVPFRRRPTLSGHRLIWDLVEAIGDHMRWLCAKLTYE